MGGGVVRVDVYREVNFFENSFFFLFIFFGGVGGRVWSEEGRCEQRIEVFVKIQKQKIIT